MIILASCIILLLILKNMQISTGLHVLGVPPEGEELVEYLLALTKLDNGKVPSLMKNLAAMHGHDYYELMEHSEQMLADGSMTYGMLLDKNTRAGKRSYLDFAKKFL